MSAMTASHEHQQCERRRNGCGALSIAQQFAQQHDVGFPSPCSTTTYSALSHVTAAATGQQWCMSLMNNKVQQGIEAGLPALVASTCPSLADACFWLARADGVYAMWWATVCCAGCKHMTGHQEKVLPWGAQTCSFVQHMHVLHKPRIRGVCGCIDVHNPSLQTARMRYLYCGSGEGMVGVNKSSASSFVWCSCAAQDGRKSLPW